MTTLDTDSASFATALGPVRVPLASLDEIWTGEFLLLWRRGTVETRIAPKARGPDVGNLWGRIAVLDGVATSSPLPSRLDPPLGNALLAFQRSCGLVPDGITGLRPLIAV